MKFTEVVFDEVENRSSLICSEWSTLGCLVITYVYEAWTFVRSTSGWSILQLKYWKESYTPNFISSLTMLIYQNCE